MRVLLPHTKTPSTKNYKGISLNADPVPRTFPCEAMERSQIMGSLNNLPRLHEGGGDRCYAFPSAVLY